MSAFGGFHGWNVTVIRHSLGDRHMLDCESVVVAREWDMSRADKFEPKVFVTTGAHGPVKGPGDPRQAIAIGEPALSLFPSGDATYSVLNPYERSVRQAEMPAIDT